MVVQRNSRVVVGNQHQEGSVDGISFTLNKGDVAILCAPNGWGKQPCLSHLVESFQRSKAKCYFAARICCDYPHGKGPGLVTVHILSEQLVP